jgi:hypothetical protein
VKHWQNPSCSFGRYNLTESTPCQSSVWYNEKFSHQYHIMICVTSRNLNWEHAAWRIWAFSFTPKSDVSSIFLHKLSLVLHASTFFFCKLTVSTLSRCLVSYLFLSHFTLSFVRCGTQQFDCTVSTLRLTSILHGN